jgi:hypothetical protein
VKPGSLAEERRVATSERMESMASMASIGSRSRVAHRSKLLSVARVLCALVPGLWLGTAALSPSVASAALCGISSNVNGVVRNDTKVELRLLSSSKGATNRWCTTPTDVVIAHSRGFFEAGDNIFETEVRATYVGTNGDVISMFAASRFFGRAEGSCSVTLGTELQCRAEVSHNSNEGGNNTLAQFFITSMGPNAADSRQFVGRRDGERSRL